ncbi:MAG: MFS transporter [Sulfobacillus sp.]
MTDRGTRSAPLLKEPSARRYLIGRVVSEIGSRITREGLPVTVVLVLAATPLQLSWLAALTMLPGLLISPAAGNLADRSRRRPLLIWGDLLRALALMAIPVLWLAHRLFFWQVLIVSVVVSAITVFYRIADQAYLPSLVGRGRLTEGNALVNVADATGEIAGPTLMGVLVQALGAPLAILADAVSYLFSALALLTIRRIEPHPQANQEETPRPDAASGLRAALAHPVLRWFLFTSGGLQLFLGGVFGTLYEIYVLRVLALSPLTMGILVTLGGVGAMAGASLFAPLTKRLGVGRALVWSLLLYALLSLLVPLAGGVWLMAVLALAGAQFLGDLAGTVYDISEVSLRQAITPDRFLGRVNGAMSWVAGALGVVGALGAGLLATAVGVRAAFWVASCGGITVALAMLASGVGRTPMPSQPDEAHFQGR